MQWVNKTTEASTIKGDVSLMRVVIKITFCGSKVRRQILVTDSVGKVFTVSATLPTGYSWPLLSFPPETYNAQYN